MKKILSIIAFLFTISSSAQDSTAINATVNIQARDLEYIGSFIYNDNNAENLYDSVKVKFRVANPPTGNTNVSITATNADWIYIMQRLKYDPTAIKLNCTQRVEAALRAAGQSYLVGKLNEMDNTAQSSYQNIRQFGRQKLRRSSN